MHEAKNEPGDTEVFPAADKEAVTPIRKFQRYLGLAIGIGVVVLAFAQVNERHLGPKAPMLEKSILNAVVWKNDRARFIALPKELALACSYAKGQLRNILKPSQREIQRAANKCDPHQVILPTGAALERTLSLDPLYLDKIGEYDELKKAAMTTQGLSEHDYDFVSRTPEMTAIASDVASTLERARQAEIRYMERLNLFVHILALAIGLLGVIWRERLGGIVLAPVAALLSGGAKAAKGIHDRV